MSALYIRSEVLIVLHCIISACLSRRFGYSDLEGFGINCTSKDRCQGHKINLTYMEKSCECDCNCSAYNDCCIDALPCQEMSTSRPAVRTDVKCLHYGTVDHAGVYVIDKCSDSWRDSKKIRQRCTGRDDFSDPLSAAPMTDVAQKKTYRNLACAKCNYANLTALTSFKPRLQCPRLGEITKKQIIANLTYNSHQQSWGAYKLNRFRNGTEFIGCNIIFDVPEYLNNSVRFCRSNLISTCAADWTRPTVAKRCQQYMAAVYSDENGYRNPHCAICNHKTVDDISCEMPITDLSGRRGVSPYPLLVDFIQDEDGNLVGQKPADTPKCPSGQIYDSFFKICRPLVCAPLPGHFLVGGRCVKI